jgi:hypothetical protein
VKALNPKIPRVIALFAATTSAMGIAGGSIAAETVVVSLATVQRLGQPQAGYFRIQIGEVEVIALSDGTAPVGLKNGLVLDAKWGSRSVDRSFL